MALRNSFSHLAWIGQKRAMPCASSSPHQSPKAINPGVFDRLDFCSKTVVHVVHVFSSCDKPMNERGLKP